MPVRHVLFVCTGNIFRSLTAEHGVRRALERTRRGVVTPSPTPPRPTTLVSSAGTEDSPLVVLPVVRDYLRSRGFDVSGHRRRTLIPAMLDEADLVVAMSTEHQRELAERFGRADVPLYTELAGYAAEPLPDVDEAVPDFRTDVAAARRHVHRTIDRILMLAPAFAARLEEER